MSKTDPAALAQQTLLAAAMRYPHAALDHPWEHTVVKVPGKKGKIFIFVDANEGRLSLTAKLPSSSHAALTLPFTEPTGYGLGRSGWVSASFDPGEDIPVELLMAWLDESYRAVAPKKLVKALDGGAAALDGQGRRALARPPATPKKAAKKTAAAGRKRAARTKKKKTAARKPTR